MISGLSAENAQTLVRLGLDLAPLNTVGTLADGVLQASAILAAAEERARPFGRGPAVSMPPRALWSQRRVLLLDPCAQVAPR